MFVIVTVLACFAGALAAPAEDLSVCVCVTDANAQYRNADWDVLGFLDSEECFIMNGGIKENAGTWFELSNVRGEETAWVSASFLQQEPEMCTNITMGLNRKLRSGFASGLVSQQCLQCICKQESGCRPLSCRMDVGSLSCGYFQIKSPYYTDCHRPGSGWKSCASDLHCSSQCVQSYMARYAHHFHCPMNCEGYAREHNGGPHGCHRSGTINYWHHVKAHTGCWKSCASDLHCSSQCVQSYMARYARHYHCPMNCEGYAREHNGGPNGCHHSSTVGYWHAVKSHSGCSHL